MINNYRFSGGLFTVSLCEFVLSGPDVLSFLDSQSTYNVKLLGHGEFHLTTFLDTTGKIETYGWLIREGNDFIYLVPDSLRTKSEERLNKFLVSEEVEIVNKGPHPWTFVLGEAGGVIFDEKASLSRGKRNDVNEIPT